MSDAWEVRVYQVGTHWRVYPGKGGLEMSYWAPWWRDLNPFSLYPEYPKTGKQLKKAIVLCEEWCRRRNEGEARARDVLNHLDFGGALGTEGHHG